MLDNEKLKAAYIAVFDCPEGRVVLRDLNRVANLTRINADEPNANAALYRVAQLNLVRRIEKLADVRDED